MFCCLVLCIRLHDLVPWMILKIFNHLTIERFGVSARMTISDNNWITGRFFSGILKNLFHAVIPLLINICIRRIIPIIVNMRSSKPTHITPCIIKKYSIPQSTSENVTSCKICDIFIEFYSIIRRCIISHIKHVGAWPETVVHTLIIHEVPIGCNSSSKLVPHFSWTTNRVCANFFRGDIRKKNNPRMKLFQLH